MTKSECIPERVEYIRCNIRVYYNRCIDSFNDKLYTIAVYLDMSKAFDTCNKDIMVMKLANWFS